MVLKPRYKSQFSTQEPDIIKKWKEKFVIVNMILGSEDCNPESI